MMKNTLIVLLISMLFGFTLEAGEQTLELVFVEGGVFAMGSGAESAFADSRPVHEVRVDDFYMSKYEITYDVFEKFWNKWYTFSDGGFGRGKQPVINVSWYTAIEFCNWLSKKEGLQPAYRINGNEVVWDISASGYRLPTEAEWEYAARGGLHNDAYQYSGSNDLDYVGWHGGQSMGGGGYGNSEFRPHTVGLKPPNALEIFDMTGNVYEWCWDRYSKVYYESSSYTNPQGPQKGLDRVVRGGSWGNTANYLRVFDRFSYLPGTVSVKIGFRVVRWAYNDSVLKPHEKKTE